MSKTTTGRQMLEALEKRVAELELKLDQVILTITAPRPTAAQEEAGQMPYKLKHDA